MSRTFRYRIYPTSEQEARLHAWSDALRFLWNLALEQRLMGLARFRDDRRYYTAFDQINDLTPLRAELPWLADVPRNVCADLLAQLDLAWQRCFKRLADEPRFKRKGRDFLNPKEPHSKQFRTRKDAVVFPKLGRIRAVIHRPLEGKARTCALVKDGDQWFAHIVTELEIPAPVERLTPVVAIDRGVVNAFADSDGILTVSPRHAEQSEEKLKRAQRVVARRKKGSRNREKAKHRVACIQRKVRRQRDHFLHVHSSRYAKSHGKVIVERLRVANMTRSAKGTTESPGRNVRRKSGLNRSILAQGWSRFVELLRYKLEQTGGSLVEVPAAYSSQTCSRCGHIASTNRKTQADFVCLGCGHNDHADLNAAKVLFSRGTHGDTVCGGFAATGRPVKQKLRTAKSWKCSGL